MGKKSNKTQTDRKILLGIGAKLLKLRATANRLTNKSEALSNESGMFKSDIDSLLDEVQGHIEK